MAYNYGWRRSLLLYGETALNPIETPVLVGSANQATGGSANTAITLTADIPQGAAVVILFTCTGGVNISSITDPRSNGLTAHYNSGGTPRTSAAFAIATTAYVAGDIITVNTSSGTGSRAFLIFYVKGISNRDSLASAIGTQANGSSGFSSITLAGPLSIANSLLYGYVVVSGSQTVATPDADYTIIGTDVSGTAIRITALYRKVSSTAGDTMGNTLSSSVSWTTNLLALKGN